MQEISLSNHTSYYKLSAKTYTRLNNQIHSSIPEAILRDSKAPCSYRLIYSEIFTQIMEEHYCNKKSATIAKNLGVSRMTVVRAINYYVKANLLSVNYQNKKSKRGRRTISISPSNAKNLLKLCKKFYQANIQHKPKHKATIKATKKAPIHKKQPSYKQSSYNMIPTPCIKNNSDTHNKDYKVSQDGKKKLSNITNNQLAKITKVAKNICNFAPQYSAQSAIKAIKKEWLHNRAKINNLEDAIVPTLIAVSKGHVYSPIGLLCKNSMESKKELKNRRENSELPPQYRNYLENQEENLNGYEF